MLNNIKIYSILFLVGGLVYAIIELLWDGSTHPAMFCCGGFALIFIGLINEIFKMKLVVQMILGAVIITALEFITGLLFNQNYEIWDYRDLPFNYKGQICLLFSIIWVGLSYIAIKLDDYLRTKLEKEDVIC